MRPSRLASPPHSPAYSPVPGLVGRDARINPNATSPRVDPATASPSGLFGNSHVGTPAPRVRGAEAMLASSMRHHRSLERLLMKRVIDGEQADRARATRPAAHSPPDSRDYRYGGGATFPADQHRVGTPFRSDSGSGSQRTPPPRTSLPRQAWTNDKSELQRPSGLHPATAEAGSSRQATSEAEARLTQAEARAVASEGALSDVRTKLRMLEEAIFAQRKEEMDERSSAEAAAREEARIRTDTMKHPRMHTHTHARSHTHTCARTHMQTHTNTHSHTANGYQIDNFCSWTHLCKCTYEESAL